MILPNIETFIGCESSFEEASIVLYGAPFDSTTSFRPGARFGPAAMRHESFGLETYSPYQDRDLMDISVFDSGDLELCFGSSEMALSDIQKRAEEILKAKIEEEAKLPVIIPEYGQTYTLDDNLTMEQTVAPIAIQSSAKREVLDKIKLLKNELNDMESIVREDYLSKKDNENEISLLKLRLKEIEDQIVKIVEKN